MANPKQGGDLFDMAKDGTKIPKDAGKQRTIPSVAGAEDRDVVTEASTDRIVTGTGDTLPSSVGEKPSGNGGKEDDYSPAPHGGRNH